MTSDEGFVLVEVNKHDSTRIRVWIFKSDVDAQRANKILSTRFDDKYYIIKRANVIEL